MNGLPFQSRFTILTHLDQKRVDLGNDALLKLTDILLGTSENLLYKTFDLMNRNFFFGK